MEENNKTDIDINRVASAMKADLRGDPEKVTHFVRVYTLARTIGELERLPEDMLNTLKLASIVHSVESENKTARISSMLSSCGVDEETSARVCNIVENQYDYEHISGLDHQILVEAELIVKFKEESTPEDEIIRIAEDRIFTNYGRALLKKAFGV